MPRRQLLLQRFLRKCGRSLNEGLHRFKSDDPQVTLRKVTHNIINANQGFLSNLYAALCWALINLKQHPETQRRLEAEIAATKDKFGENFHESQEALDSMRFCEQLLMESVRLAQRSITQIQLNATTTRAPKRPA